MRRISTTILFLLIFFQVSAQEVAGDSLQKPWQFSTSLYYYIVPNEPNSLTLMATVAYKRLHFEGRYNYEDRNTASFFTGWKFNTTGKVKFEVIPMVGFVFGNTDGFAPGLELGLSYKRFDLYSESEYIIDFSNYENNFFYTWSELAFSPLDELRTGVSIQRTLLYQTSLDIQRGFFAQYSFWKLTGGVYYFNPFSSDGFVIASLNFEF